MAARLITTDHLYSQPTGKKRRISHSQKEIMLSFIEKHPEMHNKVAPVSVTNKLWKQLMKEMEQADPTDDTRYFNNIQELKKSYNDMKRTVAHKYSKIRKGEEMLSSVDRRILKLTACSLDESELDDISENTFPTKEEEEEEEEMIPENDSRTQLIITHAPDGTVSNILELVCETEEEPPNVTVKHEVVLGHTSEASFTDDILMEKFKPKEPTIPEKLKKLKEKESSRIEEEYLKLRDPDSLSVKLKTSIEKESSLCLEELSKNPAPVTEIEIRDSPEKEFDVKKASFKKSNKMSLMKRRLLKRKFLKRQRLRNIADETADSDTDLERSLLLFMESMRDLEWRKEENTRTMVAAVKDCCNKISNAFVNISRAANAVTEYHSSLNKAEQSCSSSGSSHSKNTASFNVTTEGNS